MTRDVAIDFSENANRGPSATPNNASGMSVRESSGELTPASESVNETLIYREAGRRQTNRQQELLRFHLDFSSMLGFRITWSMVFMVLIQIPQLKHLLDMKIIHSFTFGFLLRGLFATQSQFITGRELYDGARNSLCHGANMDLLVVLSTVTAYFYSIYISFKAACSIGFEGNDFFGICSMLITYVLLYKSLKITGGTLDENEVLHINAIQVESSSLLQIVVATGHQFAERISKYLVLSVIGLSLFTWFGWFWTGILQCYPESWIPSSMSRFELAFQYGISVMLTSCFCTLELATPAASVFAIEMAASQGLLIKNGRALELARKVNCIIVENAEILTKPGASGVISTLRSENIIIIMVTSDNRGTAESIAKEVGIETVVADATPEDKAKKVRELQALGYTVAMIGQDINDLPALETADVGMAIGEGANEAADVVFMKKNLESVKTAIDISRKTFPYIFRNRLWAYGYSFFTIAVASGVPSQVIGFRFVPWIPPVGAMVASLFSALFSYIMLKKYKTP